MKTKIRYQTNWICIHITYIQTRHCLDFYLFMSQRGLLFPSSLHNLMQQRRFRKNCFPHYYGLQHLILMRKWSCMKYKQGNRHRISNTFAKCVESQKMQDCVPMEHQNRLKANCFFQQKKSQVFVFIWMSTKWRRGEYYTHTHALCTGDRARHREGAYVYESDTQREGEFSLEI